MTFVLGLTGSIGMGKTAVSNMLRDLGIPVLDADQARGVRAVALLRDARRLQCVHDLYASGGAAVPIVGEAFPGVVVDGRVDRQALSSRVVGSGNEDAMRLLEHLVHPLVAERRAQFVAAATASGAPLAVLDVPLLFETGLDAQCDAVAVVSADTATQRSRVLQRAGMTAEKLDAILARQLPDAEKRLRASIIIDTACSLDETRSAVQALVQDAANGRIARRTMS